MNFDTQQFWNGLGEDLTPGFWIAVLGIMTVLQHMATSPPWWSFWPSAGLLVVFGMMPLLWPKMYPHLSKEADDD